MFGQAYLAGDKYARRTPTGLEFILPEEKGARMKAVAAYKTMPKADFDALIGVMFKGYAE